MEKIMIVMVEDGEESFFDDLLSFFKKDERVKLLNGFNANSHLQYSNLQIDSKHRTVIRGGINIELTNYEFQILYLLAKHPGHVFSKEQIYKQVWNMPYVGAENNVVSLIHRIRKKIEPNPSKPIYILTVWGIGYKFSNAVSNE